MRTTTASSSPTARSGSFQAAVGRERAGSGSAMVRHQLVARATAPFARDDPSLGSGPSVMADEQLVAKTRRVPGDAHREPIGVELPPPSGQPVNQATHRRDERRERKQHRCRHGGGRDVAPFHVGELVGDHPLERHRVERLRQAGSHDEHRHAGPRPNARASRACSSTMTMSGYCTPMLAHSPSTRLSAPRHFGLVHGREPRARTIPVAPSQSATTARARHRSGDSADVVNPATVHAAVTRARTIPGTAATSRARRRLWWNSPVSSRAPGRMRTRHHYTPTGRRLPETGSRDQAAGS